MEIHRSAFPFGAFGYCHYAGNGLVYVGRRGERGEEENA